MAKQVTGQIKLQCPGGKATPAPPVGPALGQHGVNIKQFVDRFNEMTKDKPGLMIPVIITVYNDRSFDLKTKSPPAAILIKIAAGIPHEKKKGRDVIPGNQKKQGKYTNHKLTQEQLRGIATDKMNDLNSASVEAAMRVIAGTARSMGIEVEEA